MCLPPSPNNAISDNVSLLSTMPLISVVSSFGNWLQFSCHQLFHRMSSHAVVRDNSIGAVRFRKLLHPATLCATISGFITLRRSCVKPCIVPLSCVCQAQ